jgi:hypothetical protein
VREITIIQKKGGGVGSLELISKEMDNGLSIRSCNGSDLIASSFLLRLLWVILKSKSFHAAGLLFMSHGKIGGNKHELGNRENFSL